MVPPIVSEHQHISQGENKRTDFQEPPQLKGEPQPGLPVLLTHLRPA